ncbi:HipA family kinase [Psychrobacillus sp. FSL K6-2365]|uniref:HipA family kinase n=1 Tax=Psychrobacillus sp. FSL K6-2365 TaxID=2921546 RepID=UPI0030FC7C42
MSILTVKTFLKELGDDTGGQSNPVVVIASDDHEYILKNEKIFTPQKTWQTWDCMFLQEILVAQIGNYLKVPMPSTAIIDVEKVHIDVAPSLTFKHRYTPGKHFASKYLTEVENNLKIGYQQLKQIKKPHTNTNWINFFKKIANPKDVSRIIAMDLLIANFDRFGNEGNLMISNENGNRSVYAIDHGHAFFGASWEQLKIGHLSSISNDASVLGNYLTYFQQTSNYLFSGLGSIFRGIEQHIDCNDLANHDFVDVVNMIESIDGPMIDEWFKQIPDEFFKDKATQIATYKKFILINKKNVRSLLTMMQHLGAFSNTNGGELLWREQRTGTQ